MVQIGEILMQNRINKGYTIAEVEQYTKIPSKYIKAIEEERFDYLPGRAYAIGFLSSYADFLGMDTKGIITAFKNSFPDEDLEMDDPIKPLKNMNRSFKGIVPVTIIMLLLIGGALYFYLGMNEPTNPAIDPTTIATTAIEPTTVPIEPTTEPPEPTTVPEPEPEPIIEGLILEITAVEGDCWLGFTVDDENSRDYTLTKGHSYTITANEKIVIRYGSAGAVVTILNGETQPSLGRVGQVVNKEYLAENPVTE